VRVTIAAPSVSILIAAYNAEATLDLAVSSALAAPETAEVCIVDDASSDGTAAIATAWRARDARVVLLSATANAGPAAARNQAITATRAPWLAILDADDYMLPGRLTALLALGDGADFVADTLIRVAENAGPPDPPAIAPNPAPLNFEGFVLGNLGSRTGPLDLGFLKPLFRRAFLDQHDLRYREDMRLGEDYEFYARALALGGRFFVCPPAGYVSVERSGSLSKVHSEVDLETLRDCDDGLAAIPGLTMAEHEALRRHWASVDSRLQWRRLISAVKARNLGAALATFHTPQAALYLASRLGEQAVSRSARLLGL
jgi:succinoglycan biosynthesis protein ExoU